MMVQVQMTPEEFERFRIMEERDKALTALEVQNARLRESAKFMALAIMEAVKVAYRPAGSMVAKVKNADRLRDAYKNAESHMHEFEDCGVQI